MVYGLTMKCSFHEAVMDNSKLIEKKIETFEIWCCKKALKISWTE